MIELSGFAPNESLFYFAAAFRYMKHAQANQSEAYQIELLEQEQMKFDLSSVWDS